LHTVNITAYDLVYFYKYYTKYTRYSKPFHPRRTIMAIKIVKRVALEVISRNGACCGSACW
jgi:Mb-OB3b family methanobactin precursor